MPLQFFPSRAVALQILGFPIHWYGILYIAAFAVMIAVLPRLQRFRGMSLTREEWLDIVSWGIVGVLVGGRLGFVLFYEPAYFVAHPLEVFAVWQGGMSSHGGFIGVAVALYFAIRRKGIDAWKCADVVAAPAGIGLAFGRFGNFINQELYGPVTTLPWGIAIPGVEGLRHPTPVYALLADLCIAAACILALRSNRFRDGRILALFLLLYGVVRFFLEYVREQTYAWTTIGPVAFTRGQLLTLPVLAIGLALWFLAPRRRG